MENYIEEKSAHVRKKKHTGTEYEQEQDYGYLNFYLTMPFILGKFEEILK